MNYKIALLLCLILNSFLGFSQDELWTPISKKKVANRSLQTRKNIPKEFKLFQLDLEVLNKRLNTKNRNNSNGLPQITIPNAQGELISYHVKKSETLHPELQAKFPEVKTFKGFDSEGNSVYFSVTKLGFHSLQFSGEGTQYIDPHTSDLSTYIVYNRKSLPRSKGFSCITHENESETHDIEHRHNQTTATDSVSRVYRMAMACTTEYASFHIRRVNAQNASLTEQKEVVLAAVTTTLNRVNAIYERDFAVTMQLIPDNDKILYITDDLFSNDNSSDLFDQVKNVINTEIGSANYDIGHVVSTGGGGVASLSSVCTNDKAKGVTGTSSPIGDPYDVDFVSHEIGHQFGAYHSFNNSCSGNRNTNTSYEPGSGSTIMGYAGVCPYPIPQDEDNDFNIQHQSDDYFHAINIQEINHFIRNSTDCSVKTTLSNKAPIVDAGIEYTIPHSTPFKLTGSAVDPETNLTYCWEQFDKGNIRGKPDHTKTFGALFRSFPPVANPTRYFPNYEDLINNSVSAWEVLPSVSREMNFILSVRNRISNLNRSTDNPLINVNDLGQIGQDQTKVITSTEGPFKITSNNSCYAQNINYQITWDVAGTNSNEINTEEVNIKLSTDNGNNFDIVLATNTPNDGIENINFPQITCDNCRLLIEPTNSIYFAISEKPFSIGLDNSCLEDFILYNNLNNNSIHFQYKTTTDTEPIRINIYDITGRHVAQKWIEWSTFIDNSIDVSNLSDGIYIFHLQEYKNGIIRKIIVSNRK